MLLEITYRRHTNYCRNFYHCPEFNEVESANTMAQLGFRSKHIIGKQYNQVPSPNA